MAAETATETADTAEPSTTFAELELTPGVLAALSALGYEEPTPIQREAIPPLLAGRDLLGQAATGTGKTAAFALPILSRMPQTGGTGDGKPKALVLVPTRELAVQVSEAMHKYGRQIGARVMPIYGGQPFGRQLKALGQGIDIVVATPGRALDHIGRRTLALDGLKTVVLDEADEMLDMGFQDDIEAILAATPDDRQTVLFSATMPRRIDKLAGRHLGNPVRITLAREEPASGEAPLVRQTAYIVHRAHKPAALGRMLDVESPTAALVFCRTRADVDTLTETLNGRGYRAEALHGGMNQEGRTRVMERLKAGTADLLIATDVAARGLDIDSLTHVVNYDVPAAPEAYVHRIGRVGRAGREGVAITLAEPREHRMLKSIERTTGQKIAVEKVPTVADVHAQRLDQTRQSLRELLDAGDLESYRSVVEGLTDDFDVMEVALAAVKLAHEAGGTAELDQKDIPDATAPREGGYGDGKPKSKQRRPPSANMTRVFIGAGRLAGIRPQDLVGAIAGESRLTGRDVGAIGIEDRFSLVEVPDDAVDDVIAALRATKIKGKKTTVRREKFQARKPPPQKI